MRTATWTDLLPDPPRHRCANWPDCPSQTARRAPDGVCGTCAHERDQKETRDA